MNPDWRTVSDTNLRPRSPRHSARSFPGRGKSSSCCPFRDPRRTHHPAQASGRRRTDLRRRCLQRRGAVRTGTDSGTGRCYGARCSRRESSQPIKQSLLAGEFNSARTNADTTSRHTGIRPRTLDPGRENQALLKSSLSGLEPLENTGGSAPDPTAIADRNLDPAH